MCNSNEGDWSYVPFADAGPRRHSPTLTRSKLIRGGLGLYRFLASTREQRIRKSSSCAECCHGSTNHTQGIIENRPHTSTRHMTKIVKKEFYCRIHVNGRKRNKRDGNEASRPFRLFTHPNLSGRTFPFSNSSTLASVLVLFRFGVQLLRFAPRTV